MNELIWFIVLILSFGGVLLFYKLFGKVGLFIWLVVTVIVANIQAVKLVNLFGMETALGTIVYSTSFLVINILTEKYGKKEAFRGILIGFMAMCTMIIFMGLSLLYTPSANDFANDSLKQIFAINLRITLGSIIAYLISQYCNTLLYQRLKKKFDDKTWLTSGISTVICQLIDTVIFLSIAFIGVYSSNVLVNLFIARYVFKFVITIATSPLMIVTKKIKES
jgi:uncharacterized integral membrane protein (TIGR00697 family)